METEINVKQKTICSNWEINYKCDCCGISVFNSTKTISKCDYCGGNMKQIHPLNSRKGRTVAES